MIPTCAWQTTLTGRRPADGRASGAPQRIGEWRTRNSSRGGSRSPLGRPVLTRAHRDAPNRHGPAARGPRRLAGQSRGVPSSIRAIQRP
jgi:hypothetical protein